MQTVHAYKRLSHKWAAGWQHLDNDTFVATVKLTPSKTVREADGYDDGGTYVQHTRAPSGVNIKDLMQALRDTIGGSNCRHEHDCCGCASRSVRVKHLGSRRLLVRTDVSYNY